MGEFQGRNFEEDGRVQRFRAVPSMLSLQSLQRRRGLGSVSQAALRLRRMRIVRVQESADVRRSFMTLDKAVSVLC